MNAKIIILELIESIERFFVVTEIETDDGRESFSRLDHEWSFVGHKESLFLKLIDF